MVVTYLKLSRRALALVACSAVMIVACGGDTTYAPLEKDEAPRAVIVGGTVRNTGEEPVAAAVVTIEPMENGVSATAKWMLDRPGATSDDVPGRRVTLTSESGRYAFDDVAAGEYVLHVLADDHLGAVENFSISSTIALVDTVIVDVDLTPTGKFAGNAFLEAATSHPNTIVYVQGTSYIAVTNPAGGYTISGVPVGSYTVRATHPTYLDDTRAGTITTAGQVVALSDMTLLIDPNIPPTAIASAPSQTCELDPVTLSGTGSDADGSIVLYAWDFEDDGSVDYSSAGSADASHVYPPGTHRAKLRVTDDKGGIGFAVVTFTTVQAETVFVATIGGDDFNPGTRSLPKQTLAAGLSAAIPDTVGLCPATVLVSGDHFVSPVVFLPDMLVRGGYDSATWTRTPGNYSMVEFSGTPALAQNIHRATTISGFEFTAADGQAGFPPTERNSIAFRVISSSAVKFEDCRFLSRNGSTTSNGANGQSGGPGGAGAITPGGSGGSPGGLSGGNGGPGDTNGQTGGGGCGTGGIAGGIGGCGCGGGGGGLGGDGGGGPSCSGTHGANGGAQASHGTGGTDWTPKSGFAGLNGTPGMGGGGGGGSGTSYPTPGCPNPCGPEPGASGGGGGGGGGYGAGGQPGEGGGASFAVYLFNSTPLFVDCVFTAGNGAMGSSGGNGGSGGAGGIGALGTDTPFGPLREGGDGGNGGAGGHGGAGSGGPGGPSYCVYRAGISIPTFIGATFTGGSGGAGGAGGIRPDGLPAPAGPNGPAGSVGP